MMQRFWVVRFCLYLLACGLTIADVGQESTVSEFAPWEQTRGDLDHLNGYIKDSSSSLKVEHDEAYRSLLATSALDRNKKPALSNFLENLFRPVQEPQAQQLNTFEASDVNSTTDFKPIRINCGGKALKDAQGNEWSEDAYYNKGFKSINMPSALSATQDSSLYQTYRYDFGMFGEPLTYSFPIPNGEYQVVLYFPRKLSIAPKLRKFEVWIEDSLAFTSDEIAATQGPALSMTTHAIVSGDNLKIKFDAKTRYAYVSAIVVSALPPSAPIAPPTVPTVDPPPAPSPITPPPTNPTATAATRINVGGGQVIDTSGNTWIADNYFGGKGAIYGTCPAEIANTVDDNIYCDNRWFGPLQGPPFAYQIPVSVAGQYEVRLHFAELVSLPWPLLFRLLLLLSLTSDFWHSC
jgi:Malectin domain